MLCTYSNYNSSSIKSDNCKIKTNKITMLLTVMKTLQNGTQTKQWNIYFDIAFLVVATLNKARSKKDLIKPNNVSFVAPRLARVGWTEGGERRKWGCSGHGQPGFSLPRSGEELQTVRKSHAAVYLHFSISSHSSL